MKKIIKTLLALSAISVLAGCADGTSYRGTKLDFTTFKGYALEVCDQKEEIYDNISLTGEINYDIESVIDTVETYKYHQKINYVFDSENVRFHLVSYVEESKEDIQVPENSFSKKKLVEWYIDLDNEMGILHYAKEDTMIEGVEPTKYVSQIRSVSNALAEAKSENISIKKVFLNEGMFGVYNFFLYIGADGEQYGLYELSCLANSTTVSDYFGSPDTVTKEDFYVDFEAGNFDFDLSAVSESSEGFVETLSAKSKYESKKLMEHTFTSITEEKYEVSPEKKVDSKTTRTYTIKNKIGGKVVIPEEVKAYQPII